MCRPWFKVARGITKHEIVGCGKKPPPAADKSRQAFTPFEAWMTLIEGAEWHDNDNLSRGQVLGGRAYLARTFNWSEKSVRTFLKTLVENGMIVVEPAPKAGQETGQTSGQTKGHLKDVARLMKANIITLCNYNKFQGECLAFSGRFEAADEAVGPVDGPHVGPDVGPHYKKDKNINNNPSSGISSPLRYEDIPSPLPTGSGQDAPSAGEGSGQIDIEELATPGRGEPAPVAKVEAKPSKAAEKRAQAEQILARYAEVAKRFKLPAPKKLNDHRIRAVSARIAEYGLDGVLAAIDEIPMSRLLRGEATDWTPDFDWFFKPAKFTKIAEGGHRDEKYRRREGWTKDARKDWRNDIRDGETLRQACERNGEDVEFWESQYPPGQFDSIEYAR